MELAYRLAVDDAPYIKYIRSHMIVLITPVVEVDGRDRMVDIYRWHKAHPNEKWPHLLYWGHYVAHDNNRDAMGMTLDLTRNVLDTYLDWHAQVLHDLHESVPFLYDNTVGDGPYNAWVDPTLADEWAELGWNNVAQMQSFGMPGVFTHGDFDTWSPGYLMFLAAMHNGISRLYETFGNGGADTEKRILTPEEYSRTWYRQNPPLPIVTWSQRDNNNYEETALLSTISYFSQHTHHFLENYYLKSKRIDRRSPTLEGPAAYVIPPDAAETNRQVELLKVLKRQHVEIQQLSEAATCTSPGEKRGDKPKQETFPAGSIVIRMDQPYSRIADALLDRQFWAPDDPQKHPYDDTGWSFTHLFNLKVVRVTDASILKAGMTPLDDPATLAGKVDGTGSLLAVANTGQVSLLSLVYKLKADAKHPGDGKALRRRRQALRGRFAAHLGCSGRQLAGALHDLVARRVRLSVAPLGRDARRRRARASPSCTPGSPRRPKAGGATPSTPRACPTTTSARRPSRRRPTCARSTTSSSSRPWAAPPRRQIIDGMPMWNNAMPWEKIRPHAEPRPHRLDRRHSPRPGLRRPRAPQEVRRARRPAHHLRRHRAVRHRHRPRARRQRRAARRRARGRHRAQHRLCRQGQPGRVRLRGGLPVISANGMAFNVSNTLGRAGGRIADGSLRRAAHRPRQRGRQRRAARPQDRRSRAAGEAAAVGGEEAE